jgi:hypothetical protein
VRGVGGGLTADGGVGDDDEATGDEHAACTEEAALEVVEGASRRPRRGADHLRRLVELMHVRHRLACFVCPRARRVLEYRRRRRRSESELAVDITVGRLLHGEKGAEKQELKFPRGRFGIGTYCRAAY